MKLTYKELILKAYCYVYIYKNYGVGLDKSVDIESFCYAQVNEQIKCKIYARLSSGATVKYQDIVITLKEYELEQFISSLVNHYIY